MVAALPASLRAELATYSPEQSMVVLVGVYLLAPLFLILPFMVASVIAADSFAGERERNTLEALLYSPISDGELFLAKTLVAWLPSLLATVIGFATYTIVLNAAAWPVMHRVFFPNAMWIVLIGWAAPAVAALGLAGIVLVSLRVKTVQEAMQIGGVLVIPIVGLIVGQVRGSMMLGPRVLAIVGGVVWLISGAVLARGAKKFRRTTLISRV
jgi:ABC-2 type transport system permease protein